MNAFTQTSSKRTVAGIDVGGDRKGFHAVALKDGQFIDQKTDCDPEKIVEWCLHNEASVVAVDAPCQWSQKGASRLAERHLAEKKIYCFATPTRKGQKAGISIAGCLTAKDFTKLWYRNTDCSTEQPRHDRPALRPFRMPFCARLMAQRSKLVAKRRHGARR
jgi:hypothetical protein